jgi:hypothetical protein
MRWQVDRSSGFFFHQWRVAASRPAGVRRNYSIVAAQPAASQESTESFAVSALPTAVAGDTEIVFLFGDDAGATLISNGTTPNGTTDLSNLVENDIEWASTSGDKAIVSGASVPAEYASSTQYQNWTGIALLASSSTNAPAPPPTTTSGLQPFGVAPPAGTVWVNTLDEEFNESAVNTGLWNYGFSNEPDCTSLGCQEGVVCTATTAGALGCNDDFNFTHDSVSGDLLLQYPNANDLSPDSQSNYGGMGGLNSIGKFSQRYGYFEWEGQLPGSGSSGNWPAYWAMPESSGGSSADCTNDVGGHNEDEVDVMEDAMGGSGVTGQGSNYAVQTSIYDCGSGDVNGVPDYRIDMANGQDLTAGPHVYGLKWVNDGTANGTMTFYLDGVQQGGLYTLSAVSTGWQSGLMVLITDVPCANGIFASGPCTADDTVPLRTNYVRVWQAQ